MINEITFPGLGLEFTISEDLIRIGDFSIKWYAALIVTGMILAVVFAYRNDKKFGLDMDLLIEPVFYCITAAIIGARLYYCIFNFDAYRDNPISILYIWEGGLAIYGGIIGAAIVAVLMCKRNKLPLLPCLDLASMGLLIGQGIGRWGNFFNAEAFGSNTNLPWGMSGEAIIRELKTLLYDPTLASQINPYQPVHPTFLYESLWCLLGFLLLRLFLKHRRFDGQIGLMYLMWYGFERMFVEGLRTDSLMLGNFRISQLLSGILFVTATVVLVVILTKIKRMHDDNFMPLFVNTEASKELIAKAEKIREDDREETRRKKEARIEKRNSRKNKSEGND